MDPKNQDPIDQSKGRELLVEHRDRCAVSGSGDYPCKTDVKQAIANDQAGGEQNAHALCTPWIGSTVGTAVIEFADHRADQ